MNTVTQTAQKFVVTVKKAFTASVQWIKTRVGLIQSSTKYQTTVVKARTVAAHPTLRKVFAVAKSWIVTTAIIEAVASFFGGRGPRGNLATLIQDWRNNHIRLLDFAWRVLAMTAGSFVGWMVLVYTSKFFAIAFLLALVAGLLIEIMADRTQLTQDQAEFFDGLTFRMLSGILSAQATITFEIPARIAHYRPLWLRKLTISTRNFEPVLKTRQELREEIEQAEKTATENKVAKTAKPKVEAKVTYDSEAEAMHIEIDGVSAQVSPFEYGEDLAIKIAESLDRDSGKLFRHDLPKQLRKAGVTEKNRTRVLNAYDRKMAALVTA